MIHKDKILTEKQKKYDDYIIDLDFEMNFTSLRLKIHATNHHVYMKDDLKVTLYFIKSN